MFHILAIFLSGALGQQGQYSPQEATQNVLSWAGTTPTLHLRDALFRLQPNMQNRPQRFHKKQSSLSLLSQKQQVAENLNNIQRQPSLPSLLQKNDKHILRHESESRHHDIPIVRTAFQKMDISVTLKPVSLTDHNLFLSRNLPPNRRKSGNLQTRKLLNSFKNMLWEYRHGKRQSTNRNQSDAGKQQQVHLWQQQTEPQLRIGLPIQPFTRISTNESNFSLNNPRLTPHQFLPSHSLENINDMQQPQQLNQKGNLLDHTNVPPSPPSPPQTNILVREFIPQRLSRDRILVATVSKPTVVPYVPPRLTEASAKQKVRILITEDIGMAEISPDDAFLSCCREKKVDATCESRCNFNILSRRVLTAMLVGTDPCPQRNGRSLLSCAAQDADHTTCCRTSGVHQTAAGDKCLEFCQMTPGFEIQIDVSMLPCWSVLKKIKECFQLGLIMNYGTGKIA